MGINSLQRPPSYSYLAADGKRKQYLRQETKNGTADRRQGNGVLISEEGQDALKERLVAIERLRQAEDIKSLSSGACGIRNDFERIMSELGSGSVPDEFVSRDYSQRSVDALKARFEKEEGTRTDTFDSYVNKMASAYRLMEERIEEKYAAPGRKKEYYVAEDGSTQELTKEKELEMLYKAYETHSRFMAASTQIWSELQDFKAQTICYPAGAGTELPATENRNTKVKEQAYHAFMSAISEENRILLKQEKGNLNQIRLQFDLSASARKALNGIWDYYANRKNG